MLLEESSNEGVACLLEVKNVFKQDLVIAKAERLAERISVKWSVLSYLLFYPLNTIIIPCLFKVICEIKLFSINLSVYSDLSFLELFETLVSTKHLFRVTAHRFVRPENKRGIW